MPLSLVRLRTFNSAHALVGCNIEAGVNAGAHGGGGSVTKMSQYSETKRVTQCEWRHAPEARRGFEES